MLRENAVKWKFCDLRESPNKLNKHCEHRVRAKSVIYPALWHKNKMEWNKNPERKPNAAKLKMLQARFDWACSWTVLSSANYRHRLKQNSTFNMNW
jgi:hypothetical protein